ncbi:MAG: hypothetical protein FJW40_27020 [Acidobacteria bacterium]|nr:hypothetical protein [Acidobacteriota bacterium]
MTYFITFACYGARLHGSELGSVDPNHNRVGSPLLKPDPKRVLAARQKMLHDPYLLDERARPVVLAAIRAHSAHRGWNLLAAHVRSNHVHVIVQADTRPERIMNEFKSYASRELNHLTTGKPDQKRWARHGSTRWLWKEEDVRQALDYVINHQGDPMALFVAGNG